MPERELIRCRFCGRLFFFAPTAASGGAKRMPLNPLPKPWEPPYAKPPNVVIDEETGLARVLSCREREVLVGQPTVKRYLPHFVNCAGYHTRRRPA